MAEIAKFRESYVHVNGVRLHVVEAGPEDGPLAILLHGFPEYWSCWTRQLEALAAKGYRVVAPDQRGYNLSDKPEGVQAYGLDRLTDDVIALIDHYGRKTAVVAGHDWGACVAWWVASRNPERVEKLIILNVPHPIVMKRYLAKSFKQLRKSWYMFMFQIPKLPEKMFAANRFKVGVGSLVSSSRPGTFSADELDRYREAWAQPGALTGMLNWYRAIFRTKPVRLGRARVSVPTLIIWGTEDKFLGRELASLSNEICDRGRVEYLEGASHWVMHEEPARVNELMLGFLAN